MKSLFAHYENRVISPSPFSSAHQSANLDELSARRTVSMACFILTRKPTSRARYRTRPTADSHVTDVGPIPTCATNHRSQGHPTHPRSPLPHQHVPALGGKGPAISSSPALDTGLAHSDSSFTHRATMVYGTRTASTHHQRPPSVSRRGYKLLPSLLFR